MPVRTKRRANGEGSISRRKDGRWVARHQYEQEGQIRRCSTYSRTQAEAVKSLNEMRKTATAGMPLPGTRLTFGAYIKKWIEGRNDISRNSVKSYESVIRNNIVPTFGNISLLRLEPSDLRTG